MDEATAHLTISIRPKENVSHPSYLHSTTSFVILVAQFFGIMPLYGITENDSDKIKFEWKSARFFYTILNMCGNLTSTVFCCIQFAIIGLMLDKTAPFSFYICNFFGTLYFLKLARNWHILIGEWSKVEHTMKNYGSPRNLKKQFKIMTTVILILALVEHLLFILNGLNSMWNSQHQSPEVYFRFAFPHVFCFISYSHWKAVLVEIVNILATFCWNFLDLFIMLLSSALAERFKQINMKIQNTKITYEAFWKRVREDYNKVWILCEATDKHIAPLVTISFVSNVFFICIQLYNSLKPRYGIIPTVYFFYSFGFLLGRTLAVSLYAANINDESKEPLKILHSISSENYNVEIDRLLQQIHTNPAGITGSNFFLITRSFILQIAGTIVTFELMLLQFGPLLQQDVLHTNQNNIDEC